MESGSHVILMDGMLIFPKWGWFYLTEESHTYGHGKFSNSHIESFWILLKKGITRLYGIIPRFSAFYYIREIFSIDIDRQNLNYYSKENIIIKLLLECYNINQYNFYT